MTKILRGVALLCLISILYLACKHEIPLPITGGGGGGTVIPPPSTPTCSADTVYFQNTVLPIITSNCAMSGCHDAITHKEGLTLNSYTGIMKIVKAGNASGSKLVSVITSNNSGSVMPPPPMAKLSTTQIDAIKKWINQGAYNNNCASCDTSSFTYSGAVKTIMTNKCIGCHSGASAGAGIDLTTYNGVKTVALNGRLIGSLSWKTGFVGMPQGGARIQDCELKQIQKWIDAGTLNN